MEAIDRSITDTDGGSLSFLPVVFGVTAAAALLGIYFAALTLTSGWDYTVSQFTEFWYFVLPLVVWFGLQVGLYVYLKQLTSRIDAALSSLLLVRLRPSR